jgi:hypothetical protein
MYIKRPTVIIVDAVIIENTLEMICIENCSICFCQKIHIYFLRPQANAILKFVRTISFFSDVGEEFPSPHTGNLTNFGGGFV